jgi:hypothetical protein
MIGGALGASMVQNLIPFSVVFVVKGALNRTRRLCPEKCPEAAAIKLIPGLRLAF